MIFREREKKVDASRIVIQASIYYLIKFFINIIGGKPLAPIFMELNCFNFFFSFYSKIISTSSGPQPKLPFLLGCEIVTGGLEDLVTVTVYFFQIQEWWGYGPTIDGIRCHLHCPRGTILVDPIPLTPSHLSASGSHQLKKINVASKEDESWK